MTERLNQVLVRVIRSTGDADAATPDVSILRALQA
jgi:hypothetical protein